MTPETYLKNQVIKYLKGVRGLWFYKSSDRFTAGIPDIIGCYRGAFFAIELKDPDNGRLKALQEITIARINKARGFAISADTLKDVQRLIKEIRNGTHI